MASEAVKDAPKLLFGKLPPDPTQPCVCFGDVRLGTRRVDSGEIQFPTKIDFLAKFQDWDIRGNNVWNNCVAVTWANQRRLVSTTLAEHENYPPLTQVLELYKTQNPDVDLTRTTSNPEPDGVGGMSVQAALSNLRNHGGPDGVKALAFIKIAPKDHSLEEIRHAIAIFGSVWVGLRVSRVTENVWTDKQHFTHPNPATGGHAVLTGGYIPELRCVSWGDVGVFDESCWTDGTIDEAWAVIWPEHLGTKEFMEGVDINRLKEEMKKLGADLLLPPGTFSSMYFIKTRNQKSKSTEISVGSHKTLRYSAPKYVGSTGFSPDDGENGVFGIGADQALYFIKTRNTESNMVEIRRLLAADKYQAGADSANGIIQTQIPVSDAQDGTWTINSDLWFIRTRDPPYGVVRVCRVSHPDFASKPEIWNTDFPSPAAADGTWCVFAGDVFYIRHRNTANGQVELYTFELADVNDADIYKQVTVHKTGFTIAEFGDGCIWQVSANKDLYCTRTRGGRSGRVEISIATEKSQYARPLYYASFVGAEEDGNGQWIYAPSPDDVTEAQAK